MALRFYRLITASLFPFLKLFRSVFPRRWEMAERLDPGPPSDDPALWLHGASLGEARAVWALARNLKWPGKLILTATSVSGRDWLEKSSAAGGREDFGGRRLLIRLMPLDHTALMRTFISRNRIRIALFYEMELWPNALSELRNADVPALWVSARLTPRARHWYGHFRKSSRALMKSFTFIQARSDADAAALLAFGIDSKPGFDFKAAHYLFNPPLAAQPREAFAFLSLRANELQLFLPVLPGLMKKFHLLVFPRRPEEFPEFRAALSPLGFAIFSRGEKGPHHLVDVLGEVGNFLPRCHSAFVGGTLVPVGGHNLWEPLTAGLKIYIGPYVFNQEPLVSDLLPVGLAESISESKAAENWQVPLVEFPTQCEKFLAIEKTRLEHALRSLNGILEDVQRATGGYRSA